MMWDLGGGTYVPPDAHTPQHPQPQQGAAQPAYGYGIPFYPQFPYPPQRQSTYPPPTPTSPHSVSPFRPIGAPIPAPSPYPPSSYPSYPPSPAPYLPHSYSSSTGYTSAPSAYASNDESGGGRPRRRDTKDETRKREHGGESSARRRESVVVSGAGGKREPIVIVQHHHHHHREHHHSSSRKEDNRRHSYAGEAVVSAAVPSASGDPRRRKESDPKRPTKLTRPSHSNLNPTSHTNANQTYSHLQGRHESSKHKLKPPSSGTQPQATGHTVVATNACPSPQHHRFHYSRCTGKRKALCIGINYHNTPYELQGCINDAKNVQRFLVRHHNFRPEDMVLLTDSPQSSGRSLPTRENILDAMRWLVEGAHEDDSLFFHYSGHGSQVKDKIGDEVDGYDEVIFPLDYKEAGYIIDDLMHDIMVKPLPEGCRLTALFDSCHSASVLDLPYLYHTNGRVKGYQVSAKFIEAKSTPADVISWSGCKDDQTSADTFMAGVATGAMSYAFMNSLNENPKQTYQELLRSVRSILKDKYSQKPQLSSSHRIDTSLQFII